MVSEERGEWARTSRYVCLWVFVGVYNGSATGDGQGNSERARPTGDGQRAGAKWECLMGWVRIGLVGVPWCSAVQCCAVQCCGAWGVGEGIGK